MQQKKIEKKKVPDYPLNTNFMKGIEINILIFSGNNLTLLESKIKGGTDIDEKLQYDTNIVSIRLTTDSKHLYTGHMIDKHILLTTAKNALKIQNIGRGCETAFTIYYSNAYEVPIKVITALTPNAYKEKQKLKPKPIYDDFDVGVVVVSFC